MRQNLEKILQHQPDLIDQYLQKALSAQDLGDALGYKASYVMATLSRMGIKREIDPDSIYQQRAKVRKLRKARESYREYLAQQVLDRKMTVEAAAELASCSERTLYRYVRRLKVRRELE